MKKLRCKKEYGTWYYQKYWDSDIEGGAVYQLYDCNKEYVGTYPYYSDLFLKVEQDIEI